MKRSVPLLLIPLISLACFLSAPAHAAPGKYARGLEKYLSKTEFGFSEQLFGLAKNLINRDYDGRGSAFHVAGENLRFSSSRTTNQLTNNGSVNKFKSTLRARDYSLVLTGRLAALRRQSFSFGFGKKKVWNDPYTISTCVIVCIPQYAEKMDVMSHPYYFDYTYQLPNPWKIGLAYSSDKLVLQTVPPMRPMVTARRLTLRAARKTGKSEIELSHSRYFTSGKSHLFSEQAHGNTNTEVRAAYMPLPHARLFSTVGFFSRGVPVGEGIFSEMGNRYIFSYLGGDTDFNPIFDGRIGYYSLGINFFYTFK